MKISEPLLHMEVKDQLHYSSFQEFGILIKDTSDEWVGGMLDFGLVFKTQSLSNCLVYSLFSLNGRTGNRDFIHIGESSLRHTRRVKTTCKVCVYFFLPDILYMQWEYNLQLKSRCLPVVEKADSLASVGFH